MSQIRFDDGDAYERSMGAWSRLAGSEFLGWLGLPRGLRWVDVGCGSGLFTELIAATCDPLDVCGVDPSEPMLEHARGRVGSAPLRYVPGDAMALPLDSHSADVAVMALVIFFLPDPGRGVAEMARVVRPGGWVAAYAWDFHGGGFPFEPVQAELRRRGVKAPLPPAIDVTRMAALTDLWAAAGFEHVGTHRIVVERSFPDFERFWSDTAGAASLHVALEGLAAGERERLKAALRERLPPDADGRVAYRAAANAIVGRVPEQPRRSVAE